MRAVLWFCNSLELDNSIAPLTGIVAVVLQY